MKQIQIFLKQMITSHSGISSKRICGVIGFVSVLFVLIYCTIQSIQAPTMIEPFMYIICALLGIDSITGIFYNKNNGFKSKQKRNKENP